MNCNGGIRCSNNNYVPMQPEAPSGPVVSFGAVVAENGNHLYQQPQYGSYSQTYYPNHYEQIPAAHPQNANGIEYAKPNMPDGYIYETGFLRGNIGALMRAEFLIGGQLTDRVGILRDVGVNYIVLESTDCGSKMMCDLDSLRFATILKSAQDKSLMSGYVYP